MFKCRMMIREIDKITYLIFNRAYGSVTTKEYDRLLDKVDLQISEFGWEQTFESWRNFLFTECTTPESAINFANLFWSYGGQDHPIVTPYKFLSYFYYRINFDTDKYDALGILDSLAIEILPKAGYLCANRLINDDYIPELDPKIKAEVETYKSLGI